MDASKPVFTNEERAYWQKSWMFVTHGDVNNLHNLSDDQLLCLSTSTDLLAVVESNRRVIKELKNEAEATTKLTKMITVLTVFLVFLTIFLLGDALKDKNEGIVSELRNIEANAAKSEESTNTLLKEISNQLKQTQNEQLENRKQQIAKGKY